MSYTEPCTGTEQSSPPTDTTYYECTPCGYRSPVAVSIGLCPHCGDAISETTTL